MELWQLSATRLAAGIRTREISAVDVVTSCLSRIDSVNPALNALVDVRPDEALADARRADAAVAAGEILGPLHGVPVSTKINTPQEGRLLSHGLASLAGATSAGDEACVSALRGAGAIFLGRSNAPAFSVRWFSSNDAHGRTLNPWSADHTPGGSSGGAASSLAAGMTPLAQGNDIGGSIRFPAACCGVVGIRPTVGLVSNWTAPEDTSIEGPLTFQAWAVQGPLGRTVADARLALRAMAGADLRDPFGVPALPGSPPQTGPVRVGIVRDVGIAEPHPSVDDALDTAARWLADAGYEVEELELPLLAEAARLWSLLLFEDMRPGLPGMLHMGDEGMRVHLGYAYEYAAELWGGKPDLATYIQGWARRATLITRLQELLGRDRILLTPVSAEPPFEQDADIDDPVRGRALVAAQWPMTSLPVLGFPGVSVPTGLADGLPIGVQLIGGRFAEDVILDAAQAIEDRAPRLTPVAPR
ncbi:amidase [Streptosporangium becharense]|uniref:Amidase n=1 Tax=Streptosporangium becharense TaxID=1816182 RepID=A0A7W9IJM2_9ACTN|nr:amidase [Streptosporangium becharense]MBB2911017.1 amidase [Streptosporangium becharense]MBB5821925.1 amidase [Streptosporangium becharense]